MTPPLDKQSLRDRFIARRDAIPPEDRREWSARIRTALLTLPELKTPKTAYVYLATQGEVDTRGIVDDLLAGGWRVVAPVTQEEGLMHWGEVTGWDNLRKGRYGLFEPAEASASEHTTQGVALVPCVAFTAGCVRLGRGGGYYDRFLTQHHGPKIGLAFESQRAESLHMEDHDVPLDLVITELTTYRRDSA